MTAFLLANAALVSSQAAVVALPGRGVPPVLAGLRHGRGALVAMTCTGAVVVAGSAGAGVATTLSRLALVAVPLLAAAALGWAMRAARRAFALFVVPLVALAWWDIGALPGDAAAAALTALSCVTLGRLMAGTVPGLWLKAGLVVFAVYDAVTVFGHPEQSPDATVDAAVAVPGLPRFQFLDLHASSLGFADVFVAGVLGGVLAAQRTRQRPVALLVLGLSAAFDLLFLAYRTLPATVPVAAALLVAEAARRRKDTAAGESSHDDGTGVAFIGMDVEAEGLLCEPDSEFSDGAIASRAAWARPASSATIPARWRSAEDVHGVRGNILGNIQIVHCVRCVQIPGRSGHYGRTGRI
jgi:hypothetical protein